MGYEQVKGTYEVGDLVQVTSLVKLTSISMMSIRAHARINILDNEKNQRIPGSLLRAKLYSGERYQRPEVVERSVPFEVVYVFQKQQTGKMREEGSTIEYRIDEEIEDGHGGKVQTYLMLRCQDEALNETLFLGFDVLVAREDQVLPFGEESEQWLKIRQDEQDKLDKEKMLDVKDVQVDMRFKTETRDEVVGASIAEGPKEVYGQHISVNGLYRNDGLKRNTVYQIKDLLFDEEEDVVHVIVKEDGTSNVKALTVDKGIKNVKAVW